MQILKEDHLKFLGKEENKTYFDFLKKIYIFAKKPEMKALGSIVSKRKIKDVVGFVEVVDDIKEVSGQTNPILVVGLNEAKKIASNFSILDKKIDDNVFWTFGKTEKRDDYEKDIKKFYEYVLNKVVTDVKYYYVNLLTINFSKAKALLNIIYNDTIKYIYINNNIIYIYYNNYILGISLDIAEYMGIKRDKIISRIISNKCNKITYTDSFLDINMRKVINNKKYVVPYFMSIQE